MVPLDIQIAVPNDLVIKIRNGAKTPLQHIHSTFNKDFLARLAREVLDNILAEDVNDLPKDVKGQVDEVILDPTRASTLMDITYTVEAVSEQKQQQPLLTIHAANTATPHRPRHVPQQTHPYYPHNRAGPLPAPTAPVLDTTMQRPREHKSQVASRTGSETQAQAANGSAPRLPPPHHAMEPVKPRQNQLMNEQGRLRAPNGLYASMHAPGALSSAPDRQRAPARLHRRQGIVFG